MILRGCDGEKQKWRPCGSRTRVTAGKVTRIALIQRNFAAMDSTLSHFKNTRELILNAHGRVRWLRLDH